MTRYYGFAGGLAADENGEFSFLQKFKRTQRLPYPLAVAKNLKNYDNYGVFALPTIVLIDKKRRRAIRGHRYQKRKRS